MTANVLRSIILAFLISASTSSRSCPSATVTSLFLSQPPPSQCTTFPPFPSFPIYLLYDVNLFEGFNLRRDVHMRLVVFVRQMQRRHGWNLRLVMPPFWQLPHWHDASGTSGDHESVHFWNEFFDMPSMQSYANVLDAWQFYDAMRSAGVRQPAIHYVELMNYEMRADSRFEDRYELQQEHRKPGELPSIFGQRNHTVVSFMRARFQGSVGSVRRLLSELWQLTHAKSTPYGESNDDGAFIVYVRNAEIVLHDRFGDAEYWRARRSMRFAGRLEAVAAAFERDVMRMRTTTVGRVGVPMQRPLRWQDEQPRRSASGIPFVCAHLRRRDFLTAGRVEQVPTLRLAAEQLRLVLQLNGLADVFVASDCTGMEFKDLQRFLPHVRVHRFRPKHADRRLSAGSTAIVDQIVCSHAAHFIGTFESTFTFRIQEEREILGFDASATFNTFCGRRAMAAGGGAERCERNSRWLIEYDDDDDEFE